MKHLYLVNETSRAANYGIGTYIDQLVKTLMIEDIKLHVIYLYSVKHKKLFFEIINGVEYIYIPSNQYENNIAYKKVFNRYYENAFFLLRPYLVQDEEMIFHFNFMNAEKFVYLLKKSIKCKVVLTVHYMNWSFDLLGDTTKLKKILNNPKTSEEIRIRRGVMLEKRFIAKYCDHVIAIANHSYKTLKEIYLIPEDKMTQVPNGLEDVYVPLSKPDTESLRQRYGLAPQEKVIVFAGRLDSVKGLSFLLDAYNKVLTSSPDLRLFVAGDGSYNTFLKNVNPNWSKVSFTGFISKKELYELYSIADIGVVPSLHEEFGYVALEMMMMKLPLIVNKTTGLSEIVEDGKGGLTVNLSNETDQKEMSALDLEQKLMELLNDKPLSEKYGENGRNRFLDLYEMKHFRNNMLNYYRGI